MYGIYYGLKASTQKRAHLHTAETMFLDLMFGFTHLPFWALQMSYPLSITSEALARFP